MITLQRHFGLIFASATGDRHPKHFHKRAYHLEPQSIRKPVYCITKGRAPIMDIIRTFETVGIIPPGNPLAPLGHVARGLVRSWKR